MSHQVSLTFPTATYTSSNKPSVVTLQGDLSAIEEAHNALDSSILGLVYPIGSIYISTVSTNPATLFGFGTWTAFAAGRTLIGVGTSDQTFAAGATGGASNVSIAHTHQGADHTHQIDDHFTDSYTESNGRNFTLGGTIANNTHPTGGASALTTSGMSANSNPSTLSPYIVTYMWKRES